jgi:eukaryotic-like serine/threonine-protein kinase
MSPADPERLLAGRYRLHAIIGRGGMGVVWQARDDLLGRDVAVKEIIWPSHMDAAEWDLARQRAQREAQMAARLNHPNVVGIYDVVDEDDRPWIIMELVPFRSLRDRVQADGPLTPAQAAQVGLGILAALRAAHKVGVLHRDVKPANVLIAPEGRVVLTDFGIARATDSPVLTGTGVLVGSPSYISPERARGSRAAAPADLWALGACLYAAVEGRPPFDREGALASLTAVVTEEPDPPTHAGPLWPVISGLLRKDPGERLSAAQVEEMLQQLAEGSAPLTLATEATPEASGAAGAPEVGAAAAVDAGAGAGAAFEADVSAEGPEASGEHEVVGAESVAAEAGGVAAESAEESGTSGDREVAGSESAEAAGTGGVPGETPGKPATGPLPVAGETVEDAGLGLAVDAGTDPDGSGGPGAGDSGEPGAGNSGEPGAGNSGSSGESGLGGGLEAGPDGLPRRPEVAFPAAVAASAAVAGPGADGRDQSRERKRVLLVAAAAVVVIVAVVVSLVLTSNHSPGSHQAAPPAASPSTSAPARPSATPSATSSASPSVSPSASASGSGGSVALPAGFQRFTNSTGFSIGVPDGWQVSHVGHYVYIRDPANGGIFLLIDQSDQPQPNALADWKQQAAARQDTYPDYRLLRLQSVSYPQAEQAADWEFTYDRDNIPVHILSRNVLANATHAYALYWSTPASDWSADYHYFQAFAATFRPAS